MGKIRKGHPRFGAKVGDVVDGWECIKRRGCCVIDNSDRSWGSFASIEEASQFAADWDLAIPDDRPHRVVSGLTRWRRVRPKLRWAVYGGAFGLHDESGMTRFLPHAHVVDAAPGDEWMVLKYPPHVTTHDQRKRFAERLARLYGYEVER